VIPRGKSKDKSGDVNGEYHPHTISAVNLLPPAKKREIYSQLIPAQLIESFNFSQDFSDAQGNDLLRISCEPGSSDVEMELFHIYGSRDPVLYGHITDTIIEQIHVLLYVLNDPASTRFDIDRMPDGTQTKFGTQDRNIEAEIGAMNYGLAPGQIRRGLRLLGHAIEAFEGFVISLGHEMYFTEPLYYHNAIIFERYGFAYERGNHLTQRIQNGFSPGGDLFELLDNSSPFRFPQAANSIRLRSWALHDGLMGELFQGVTMYKKINKPKNLNSSLDCPW